MDTNKNNNKNASHLTHKMKKEHGGLAEAGMKAPIESKWHELADTRAEMREEKEKQLEEKAIQLGIKEESMARECESFEKEKKSFEREKKLMKKEFQLEKEILEIYYNNGYLPQKNKHEIKYDDTIDAEPEDEKD
ncbi:hypothetical protein KII77_03685 [Helicobacter pylori]|uniref:hypothetical protein n=1 Tax=Helicobacter pylori TaxID=210 RepID=UPI001F10C243|nr:hypothetical protein [Helicobacter pylori]MCH4604268.1 hypothetical protein [Helicobacter pylori]